MTIRLYELGQLQTDGRDAYGCQHMLAWWPRFNALCLRLGYVHETLDIVQAYGHAAASAGTHEAGTCVDVVQTDPRVAILARRAGAPGTWPRGHEQGLSPHTHIGLDCPCPSKADYQVAAVKAGYDGLGHLGEGGKDYVARPDVWRNFSTGLVWLEDQLNAKDGTTVTNKGGEGTVKSWLDTELIVTHADREMKADPIVQSARHTFGAILRQAVLAENNAENALKRLDDIDAKLDTIITLLKGAK